MFSFFHLFFGWFLIFLEWFQGDNKCSNKGLVLEKNEFDFCYTFRKIGGGVRPEYNKCYTFFTLIWRPNRVFGPPHSLLSWVEKCQSLLTDIGIYFLKLNGIISTMGSWITESCASCLIKRYFFLLGIKYRMKKYLVMVDVRGGTSILLRVLMKWSKGSTK